MSLSSGRHADRWGNRTAVVDEDRRISYAELANRIATAAERLTRLGIGEGDRVALVSRNRAEVLVAMFAVWRVGGVFAPVSHRLTPATVSRPMERIDPDLVLFESAQRDLVRQVDARSFEEFEHVMSSGDSTADAAPVERDRGDTCLLVHTEDGNRVVSLSKRAVEWNCIAATAGWGLGRDDCTVTLLPLSLSTCLLGFSLPLLTVGGRVVLRRAFDPGEALSAIESHDATCIVAGPTECRELADVVSEPHLPSLDWAATSDRVPADVREAFPVPLLRVYGRPETGVNVLRETPESGPVAYPFPGYSIRIGNGADGEDETGGEEGQDDEDDVGELFVRGPATADGYLNGEAFGEWVPTGDEFRRESADSDGVIPVDDDAEGPRIHPRAIETVLESHPEVRVAGIVETVAETGGSSPKALVVGDVSPGPLREFAEERLAPYEVPRSIELVTTLPQRPTGELDRAKLRTRFGTRASDVE